MGDQVKKISFGFSKLAKKTAIVSSSLHKNNQDDVSKVELIDCLESKSIKLKDPIKQDQGPLVIPLIKPKLEKTFTQEINSQEIKIDSVKKELQNDIINDCVVLKNDENAKPDNLNGNESEIKHETLDEKAAREILEELKQKNEEDDENHRDFSVPLTSNAPTGEKESTLEDYDNIPVNAFGMAMLRGMGWAPGKGIGKTEKLVTPTLPAPRPKGMGLGADKVIKPVDKKNSNEELKMVKGSYVRVLAGPEKDTYGQIEGFDDESGRLIVKLVLKNVSVSLNEFMVQLVDTIEFKKNSKVINVSKYERYKEDEVKKESGGKILQETVHEKAYNRESVSDKQERSYYDKSKYKEKSSRSSERKERSHRAKRVEGHSEFHLSRDSIHNTNKSSNRPYDSNGRKSPRSPSRNHKYQSIKPESSSKYSDKTVTSYDKKGRSYSSDTSDSSRSYRTSSTNKIKSSKAKSPINDKSLSRGRSSSISSTSSDSSGNYSRKRNKKHKKKTSSSKYRSRSRSRSPRKHKHRKREKYT